MTNDEDMSFTIDGGTMDDIGTQHFRWSYDVGVSEELARKMTLMYKHYRKTLQENGPNPDEDEKDLLFLKNFKFPDIQQPVDLDDLINKNPNGFVIMDPNQPSRLPRQQISINQQLQQMSITQQQQQQKTTTSIESQHTPTIPVSHSSSSASTNKESNPARQQLQPKNPNL